MLGLESPEELAVTLLLLLARAGLVQDVQAAPSVAVDARDAVDVRRHALPNDRARDAARSPTPACMMANRRTEKLKPTVR